MGLLILLVYVVGTNCLGQITWGFFCVCVFFFFYNHSFLRASFFVSESVHVTILCVARRPILRSLIIQKAADGEPAAYWELMNSGYLQTTESILHAQRISVIKHGNAPPPQKKTAAANYEQFSLQ